MGFLKTLSEFYTDLCKKAANSEKPDAVLTKDNISEFFLSFVDRNDSETEGSEYYRKRYEEENKDNRYSNMNEFIYEQVLFIHEKRDIRMEYLRLKEEAADYMNLLKSKKKSYEIELRNIGNEKNNQKAKILYYKQIIEQKIKKAEQRSMTEELVREAINVCSIPSYMRWFNRGFEWDILFVQDIDTDKRNLIYFGELSISNVRQMMLLKKNNKDDYLNAFEEVILNLEIVDKINEIANNNYYLRNRKNIFNTALELFGSKNYEAFVYLIVPQIEGLFQLYLRLLGDNSSCGGMQEIVKKIKEREDFFEFVYFAYDFSDLRNKIAHGEMITVNREQAYEVLMDTYWIVKEIDSNQRDYKLCLDFVEQCTKSNSLSTNIVRMLEYFKEYDSEKYVKLLKRYLHDDFNDVIAWYKYINQVNVLNDMLQNMMFYEAMWKDGPLQINKGNVDIGGKNYQTLKYNDSGIKYQNLVEVLKQYDYVPENWYKKYTVFCENMKKLKEENSHKLTLEVDDEI